MRKARLLSCGICIGALWAGQPLGRPEAAAASQVEGAQNMQRVGIGITVDGKIDLGPYSKLAPWPNTDGRYLYSGCYDPAPLVKNVLGSDRCFMTVDLRDPLKPVRLATVNTFDPVHSPPPPAGHIVWSPTYPFANLPVRVPCQVDWNGPDIAAGKQAPGCWDPGWNTHTSYVAEGPGKLLAVNQERYRGGTNRQANYHGVKFYDVSNPAKPVFLSYWEAPVSLVHPVSGESPDANGVHHFNFKGRYLYLGTEYKGYVGKILVILDVRDARNSKESGKWWIPGQKTPEEDAVRDWVQQPNFSNPVVKDPNGKWTKQVRMHYVTIQGNSPVEVGYYEYRIDKDLGVENPAYSGSDTYDVLFGPGGYLYVSDGTAGLRVLKYTGRREPGK